MSRNLILAFGGDEEQGGSTLPRDPKLGDDDERLQGPHSIEPIPRSS